MIDAANWLFLLLQIFFVDLLLGADNAVVIALACRRLPPQETRRAIFLGAIGAIVLRLVMLLFANALLDVPLVKLVGAWMLIVIALNVRAQTYDGDAGDIKRAGTGHDFVAAAAIIMLADAAMSLDNVVALAAIAGGAFWLLAAGVLISIPIIAYGALILSALVRGAPEIIAVGAAFLGWIAGAMAVSDPLVASWIQANAPALAVIAPALIAMFVFFGGDRNGAKDAGRTARPSAAPRSRTSASPTGRLTAVPRAAALSASPDRRLQPRTFAPAAAPEEDRPPAFAAEAPPGSASGWTEERVVIAGFVLLAFLAGLIIFIASFFDSLT